MITRERFVISVHMDRPKFILIGYCGFLSKQLCSNCQ